MTILNKVSYQNRILVGFKDIEIASQKIIKLFYYFIRFKNTLFISIIGWLNAIKTEVIDKDLLRLNIFMRFMVDQGMNVFFTNFLVGLYSIIVYSTGAVLLKNVLNICWVGTWSLRVEFNTYWVVGSSWIVWICIGIGIFKMDSWIAIGVKGLIISASSAVNPPEFWRLLKPFWIIFST